jgi:hypothetical protein
VTQAQFPRLADGVLPVTLRKALRWRAVVPRGATGWHLPVLVLACALLVGGLLIFFGGLSPRPSSAPDSLPAKVVDSTPCGSLEARDTVQVMMNGRDQRLVLDGCGNPVGMELQVEVWHEGAQARLAGTGHPAAGGLTERISMLLLVLAGLAGGLFALVVPARRS